MVLSGGLWFGRDFYIHANNRVEFGAVRFDSVGWGGVW